MLKQWTLEGLRPCSERWRAVADGSINDEQYARWDVFFWHMLVPQLLQKASWKNSTQTAPQLYKSIGVRQLWWSMPAAVFIVILHEILDYCKPSLNVIPMWPPVELPYSTFIPGQASRVPPADQYISTNVGRLYTKRLRIDENKSNKLGIVNTSDQQY